MGKNCTINITVLFIFLGVMLYACRKDMQSAAVITTNPVTSITPSSAVTGGNITNDGGSNIFVRGVCWNRVQDPTINDEHISQGGGNGRFICNITGLLSNTKYYLKAYAVNNYGVSYGEEIVFRTDSFRIGLFYEGGKIFYIDPSGEHGLISALTDYPSDVPWYGNSYFEPVAMGNEIGEGKLNTIRIVNELGVGEYAAYVCFSQWLNGFHDWYLPSFRELTLMYEERESIGGFVNVCYWSSTQSKFPDMTTIWWFGAKALNFLNGNSVVFPGKIELCRVRQIRSF
jgi:hypothetical protein